MTKKIVFLDRESLDARVRPFNFPHEYVEHASTWTPEEIVSRLQGAEIALINKVPMRAETLKQLPDLKLIAVAATGTDVVDKAAAKAQGITVVNIRNYAFNTVPEHVVGLMFALRRAIVPYANSVRRGDWAKSKQFCYFDYPIYDIAGSTLGIVGYGALGKSIAKRAEALGMKVIAWSQNLTTEKAKAAGAELVSKEQLFSESDAVSIHLVLGPRSRGLIGAADFARMKKGAIFINTSRGPIVDEAALIAAIRGGRIIAALDVFDREPLPSDNPFRDLPNTVLTPHLGFTTVEGLHAFYQPAMENILAFLDGKPVNLMNPEVLKR